MKRILLLTLAFLFIFSCQTKEEKAISSFKKEINKEYKIYNSYFTTFKYYLKDVSIKEFDVIANDSTPREYAESLNDYWMFKPSYANILQKINTIERNMSIADSISTKILTLNDSLVKYNVRDSLINLKFSEIKDNNNKVLQAKYYISQVKKFLKLKDDFYNTIDNIVVDGGWNTTGYLMNKKSSMKFYKYEEGYRFMVRYGGLNGYSYKKTTADEVYELSDPYVFNATNKYEENFNVLEWKATGFSSSANGGRISFDKNFGKGSKLQITFTDENGKGTDFGNYIRYWFGNDFNSYYGTYKLEGKQKDIVQDFFRLNSAEKIVAQNIEKGKFSNTDEGINDIGNTQSKIPNRAFINVDNLNLRSTPEISDNIIGKLRLNEEVTFVESITVDLTEAKNGTLNKKITVQKDDYEYTFNKHKSVEIIDTNGDYELMVNISIGQGKKITVPISINDLEITKKVEWAKIIQGKKTGYTYKKFLDFK